MSEAATYPVVSKPDDDDAASAGTAAADTPRSTEHAQPWGGCLVASQYSL
jgi:hypothetical protein